MTAPASPTKVTIRFVHVTDVYMLQHFPALATCIKEARAENVHGPTYSVLTGDFLAPYLLSSLDKGRGMISMLNETPIDLLTWGNHDINDLDGGSVLARIKEYKGKVINTNMTGHDTHKLDNSYDRLVLEADSKDGSNKRKIGLIGVLSKSENLYGNRINIPEDVEIEDPWETIAKVKKELESPPSSVDTVIPLCHLYEYQDDKTCEMFDVPVVLSGHDHHVVDRVHSGTRLLKPGSDAKKAIILDLTWDDASQAKPTVDARVVTVADYAEDPQVADTREAATKILKHLEKTQLCVIPERFRPLKSAHRDGRCSTGTFLCTMIKKAVNGRHRAGKAIDGVVIAGGSIRGGRSYPESAYFSIKDLKSEFKASTCLEIARIPGSVLRAGVKSTRGNPNPEMFQCDEGIVENDDGEIIKVNNEPIDLDREYLIATVDDMWRGAAAPFVEYFKEHPDKKTNEEEGYGSIYALLIDQFAGSVATQLIGKLDVDGDRMISAEELAQYDVDQNGYIDVKEMMAVMSKLGYDVDPEETEFVREVMEAAGDLDGDGRLTLKELNEHLNKKPRVV